MPIPKKTPAAKTAPASKAAPQRQAEEVAMTIRLPKPLHTKLADIAASEGKPVGAKAVQAIREHAALYERAAKTVQTYARKK